MKFWLFLSNSFTTAIKNFYLLYRFHLRVSYLVAGFHCWHVCRSRIYIIRTKRDKEHQNYNFSYSEIRFLKWKNRKTVFIYEMTPEGDFFRFKPCFHHDFESRWRLLRENFLHAILWGASVLEYSMIMGRKERTLGTTLRRCILSYILTSLHRASTFRPRRADDNKRWLWRHRLKNLSKGKIKLFEIARGDQRQWYVCHVSKVDCGINPRPTGTHRSL